MTTNVKVLPIKEPDDATVKAHLDASGVDLPTRETRLATAYRNYRALGWKPVLLKPGKKRPSQQSWLDKDAPDQSLFVGFANIGVALGEKSKGLVDVDLDSPDVIDAAPSFLPITPTKFGRYYGTDSQKLGHWLYYAPDITKLITLKNPQGKTALELRSTGGQTMFPPSMIWDPEIQQIDVVQWAGRQWQVSTEPTLVTGTDLELRARVMLVSTYSCPSFKEGAFHTDMLAWCGYLVSAGIERELAELSVRFIVEKTGQRGVEDRVQGLLDTIEKHAHQEPLTGLKYLEDGGWDVNLCRWLRQILRFKPGFESDGRPLYKVLPTKESKWYEEISLAMRASGVFFNYGGAVSVVMRQRGVTEPVMTLLTTKHGVYNFLNREIQFTKLAQDQNTNLIREVPSIPPDRTCSEFADSSTDKSTLPTIKTLSTMPVITKEGRIIENSWAYDEELQVFFACAYTVRKYKVDEALSILKEPLVDFPFEGGPIQSSDSQSGERWGRYRAAAMASILTTVIRPVLDTCPAFIITSSQYRDGKTTLCSVPAAVSGIRDVVTTQLARGGNEEEQEKQISSILLRGKRVVIIDNRDGEFKSAPMVEALTSAAPEFRALSKNEIKSVSNKAIFMINGVNLLPAEDLASRCVTIKLERQDIDTVRKFKHPDIIGWTHGHKEELISAAICLIEWAMKKDDGNWESSNRFRDWDFMVRRTVLLACGVDIAPPAWEDDDRSVSGEEEAKKEIMEWVVDLWKQGLRSPKSTSKSWFRASDLVDKIGLGSDVDTAIGSLCRRNDEGVRRVGRVLKAIAGVYKLECGEVWALKIGVTDKLSTYRLLKIKEAC